MRQDSGSANRLNVADSALPFLLQLFVSSFQTIGEFIYPVFRLFETGGQQRRGITPLSLLHQFGEL
jgi:hypothetical protein